jgi:hypothetical protein
MPYETEIDHAAKRLFVTASDPVGLPDVLDLLSRQIAAGAWSYGSVHDARAVTWLPTLDDIRVIVAYVDNNSRTLGPRGAVAFVAAPAARFGMARMYSQIALGSGLRAEVFQSVDAAARWLDSDDSDPTRRRSL